MLNLRREQAPISKDAWKEIDEEATRVLKLNMAARKLVDFCGPHGWDRACMGTGRVRPIEPLDGIAAGLRESQPLVELRVPFELSRTELELVDRGARDPDLDPVVDAAKRLARAEDSAVFHGYGAAGIRGIGDDSKHPPQTISEDYAEYPFTVAQVTNMLKEIGVDGPYAVALGPRCYAGLVQAPSEGGGFPVIDRLRNVLDGPIVWAPSIDGAVVLSMRGGDFELHVGQDVSIGYSHHTETSVHLYMVETFTFLNLAPEAGAALRYAS